MPKVIIKPQIKIALRFLLGLKGYHMKRRRNKILHLALPALLVALLVLISGCRDFIPEKAQVSEYPLLRESFDSDFQEALAIALKNEFRGQYSQAIENKKAAFVVVDITDLKQPKTAGVNLDVMLYSASLPKIAILLGAFVQIERGEMTLDDETRAELTRMIRNSSNPAATNILNRVGIENLAEILQSNTAFMIQNTTGACRSDVITAAGRNGKGIR